MSEAESLGESPARFFNLSSYSRLPHYHRCPLPHSKRNESPDLSKPHNAASWVLFTSHFPFLGAADLPEGHRLHLQRCCCQESRAHLNRGGSWHSYLCFLFTSAVTDEIAASSKTRQSQAGAFETPLLILQGMDPGILPLGHPYSAAALPWANSDSDFCYPVLKPPLKHGGN